MGEKGVWKLKNHTEIKQHLGISQGGYMLCYFLALTRKFLESPSNIHKIISRLFKFFLYINDSELEVRIGDFFFVPLNRH